jgi:hypothetical protein
MGQRGIYLSSGSTSDLVLGGFSIRLAAPQSALSNITSCLCLWRISDLGQVSPKSQLSNGGFRVAYTRLFRTQLSNDLLIQSATEFCEDWPGRTRATGRRRIFSNVCLLKRLHQIRLALFNEAPETWDCREWLTTTDMSYWSLRATDRYIVGDKCDRKVVS